MLTVLVYNLLITVLSDVVDLQKAITSDVPDVTAQTSDNKSTEELWEIIRFAKFRSLFLPYLRSLFLPYRYFYPSDCFYP